MQESRPHTIQIEYNLFLKMVIYFSGHMDFEDPEFEEIYKGIRGKIEAIERRTLYTAYKTASSVVERERARQKYLDMMGIPDSFRWSSANDINVSRKDLTDSSSN